MIKPAEEQKISVEIQALAEKTKTVIQVEAEKEKTIFDAKAEAIQAKADAYEKLKQAGRMLQVIEAVGMSPTDLLKK